jgi:ABC-type transport system involved in cytochrome bd biosynthesis fused ATPase/permease subunit
METNDIKNIWKAGVEKDIKPYSEEELNEMVVKSARKSIKAVYPGTIFRLVIIAVIIYITATLFLRKHSIEGMLLDIGALVILSVSYFVWERSAYKMRKYTNGKPVKEWLEYRIKEIEKSIKFTAKYDWAIYACSFLFAIGFYAFYQIMANITPGILTVIVIPAGIIIYLLIVRRSLNRNYQKALHELKGLYKQFEDSNE